MICPCGPSIPYAQCCGQYIDMNVLAPTPEALMRSRYTAFVLGKIDYLSQTMQGKALKVFKFEGLECWLKQIQWQGLIIIRTHMKTTRHGFVTFEATYLEEGLVKTIHEKSEFKKINNKWFYVDGQHLNKKS